MTRIRIRRLRSNGRWLVCFDGRFCTREADTWREAIRLAHRWPATAQARVMEEAAHLARLGYQRPFIIARLAEGLDLTEDTVRGHLDSFEEVALDSDPAYARYVEEIPVTFVDGRQHDYWRVDEGRLRAALHG